MGYQRGQTENKNFLTIPKGENLELRFGYSDWGGKNRLDIRQWGKHRETGNMVPTKAGLSVPFEEIDSFMNALSKVIPQVIKYAASKVAPVEAEFMADPIFNPQAEDVKTLDPKDLKGENKWG